MPHNIAAVTAVGVATGQLVMFAQDATAGDLAEAFPELTLATAACGLAWYLLRRSDSTTSERFDDNRTLIEALRLENLAERQARERERAEHAEERERLLEIISQAQDSTPPRSARRRDDIARERGDDR